MRTIRTRSSEGLSREWDVVVIGSGMGGLSAASLLSTDGKKVLVLEAGIHPGGCSSSYARKGYVFESGATTLVGFDPGQPMKFLEEHTGIRIPRKELNPSMSVWLDDQKPIIRMKDKGDWLNHCIGHFRQEKAQRLFWNKAFHVADRVWNISLKNTFFPPAKVADFFRLALNNSPKDLAILPYMTRSVEQVAKSCGISNESFFRFLDEQLIITAQAGAAQTPFIFGAPAVCYPNSSNFYVPGGLIEMVFSCLDHLESNQGQWLNKQRVIQIEQVKKGYRITTDKGVEVQAPVVISNIPIWNMPDLTQDDMQDYFSKESAKYSDAWGAFTMGVALSDTLPDELSLHHQFHLPASHPYSKWIGHSFFVSISMRGDTERAPEGQRVLNVSTHCDPEKWLGLDQKSHDNKKLEVQQYLFEQLQQRLPGANKADCFQLDAATPRTWEKWVYRKDGRVGGIPQSMRRAVWDWTSPVTPFKGLYLVGDTTYPGQGIPGVTLSGINVYYRIKKDYK